MTQSGFIKASIDGGSTLENYNFLSYGQTYPDALARIDALLRTQVGDLLHMLLRYIQIRLDIGHNIVDPLEAKVLIAIEQIHCPDIPYLVEKPIMVDVLLGKTFDLSMEIAMAVPNYKKPGAMALVAREPARFEDQMREIADLLDNAVGEQGNAPFFPSRRGRRSHMTLRN